MEVVRCSFDELAHVGSLVAHPRNRHIHSEEQIERLAKLIAHQGQRHPIIVSKLSGAIVVGHGRWEAIKRLGWQRCAVNYQEFPDADTEYQFLISDNAVGKDEWASLDLAAINMDLEDFGPFDIDLLGIKDFTVEPLEKFEPGSDDDEVPEIRHAITRRGDIWLLGNHRLMCGDSTMIDDVEKLMAGEKADMVFTDPPYGMRLDTHYQRSDRVKGNNYRPVIGDNEDFDPSFLIELFKDSKEMFVWGADYFHNRLPPGGSFIVWDKRNDELKDAVGNDFELCWSREHHKRLVFRKLWSGFTARERDEKRVHPTQKPVELVEWFIDQWADRCHLIIDLFMGSGTTLIGCEKKGKKSFGMEMDEQYCDVIINRWQKYTGKEATLELTGQTYAQLKEERDGGEKF